MKIPTFTIEAPGLNQQVAGVEYQPCASEYAWKAGWYFEPSAYAWEAGWYCVADIDGETVEFFVGQPYGYENNNGRCTIQRMENGEWKDIPGAIITAVEWEEI